MKEQGEDQEAAVQMSSTVIPPVQSRRGRDSSGGMCSDALWGVHSR